MRLRQLEAFRATIITGTMSAAAESLQTSQPTISRLLSELEFDLKLSLFRRERGRVKPTHEGLEFYRRVDKVMTEIAALRDAADDLRRDAFREIRIISPPAVAMGVVPEVMARLTERYPNINAKLITVDKNSYFAANCETEFDIVLGNRIGFEGSMDQIPLAQVDFVCALPQGHRLAERAAIKVSDLDGESMISLLDDERRVFLKHEKLFDMAGVSVKERIFTHTSATAYGMVHRGLGVALMEPFTAPVWEAYGVVIRPFRPKLSYEYVAGVKPGAHQSSAISTIISIARDVMGKFGTPSERS